MNAVNDKRAAAILVLESDGYEVMEYGDSLLASKYCEREPGGVMCLLLEVNPPFDKAQPWGGIPHKSEDSLARVVDHVNVNLRKIRTSNLSQMR